MSIQLDLIMDLIIKTFRFLGWRRYANQDLKLLKKVVCYNQGRLAEYAYLASEKHKKIKDELKKEKSLCDINCLEKYCRELEAYLNSELRNICEENFRYILEYFGKRSGIEPRVCIKVFNRGNIVTLFRDCTIIPNKEYPISENTAFKHIHETGNWYICNDIPSSAKEQTYKNARIVERDVLSYKTSWLREIIAKYFVKPDKKWIKCWDIPPTQAGLTLKLKAKSCYKSTLVIPMTLVNNTLSEQFKNHFKVDAISPKTIYGFLCFDNHTQGFFDEEHDVWIGYIFADILSLYLIDKLTYTTYSNTFNEATKLINAKDNH